MADKHALVRRPRIPVGNFAESPVEVVGTELFKLWERQLWESEVAYDRFHRYYLPQPAPRCVLEA